MPWTMFDIICVSLFLAYLLLARVGMNNVNVVNGFKLTGLIYPCDRFAAVWQRLVQFQGGLGVFPVVRMLQDVVRLRSAVGSARSVSRPNKIDGSA